MKKRIFWLAIPALVVVFSIVAWAAAVIGSQDWQIISAPGSPASGFLRIWATSGAAFGCKTSAGATCTLDPQATSSAYGVVKPDNTSITIAGGVITATSGGSLPPPSGSATTYYIATTGSDSNDCSSGSKCATIARVLSLVPAAIYKPYVINVADGTYSEGILFAGYTGTVTTGVSIVGNAGTPANVVFSSSVNCVGADGATYTTNLCDTSRAYLSLTGVTLSATATRGIFCYDGCHLILSAVNEHATSQYGIEPSLDSSIETIGNVDIQNHASGGSGGVGIHINLGGKFIQYETSVVSMSNPATSASWGIDIVGSGSAYEIHSGTSSGLTISGSGIGVLVKANASFTEIISGFGGTISFSNASTPSSSAGFYVEGGASVFVNPGTVALTHFTNGLQQDTWGSITVKTLTCTSCGSTSSIGNAGSVNFNF